jgi:predicted RND superfamily exporter protein
VFPLAILLVFLVLAAQYESLTLPLAIILIVPMGLLAAMTGVWLTGGDNNVFTQIGLIVLVGLSAKNAILIVEFARELEFAGRTPVEAAIEASRLRLRPILMTSLAFIMGVLPLVLSTGAGAEMRHAMGVAVFAGMIGVTAFGLFLTPVFYVLLRALTGNRPLKLHGEVPHGEASRPSRAAAARVRMRSRPRRSSFTNNNKHQVQEFIMNHTSSKLRTALLPLLAPWCWPAAPPAPRSTGQHSRRARGFKECGALDRSAAPADGAIAAPGGRCSPIRCWTSWSSAPAPTTTASRWPRRGWPRPAPSCATPMPTACRSSA